MENIHRNNENMQRNRHDIVIKPMSLLQLILILAATVILGVVAEGLRAKLHEANKELKELSTLTLKLESENTKELQCLSGHILKFKSQNEKLVKKMESELGNVQQKQDELIDKLESLAKRLETEMSSHSNEQQVAVHNPCQPGYEPNHATHTCLRLVKEEKAWVDAARHCQNDGEHLATFDKMGSATWFINVRYSNTAWRAGSAWVGGKRDEKEGWFWVTNGLVPIDQLPWGEGEPDDGTEYCLFSQPKDDFKFHDWDCDQKLIFVCETSPIRR